MKQSKLQISAGQLFWILILFEIGVSTLLSVNPVVTLAGRDGWISALLATGLSLLLVYFALRLTRFYPEQSLIQFSQRILGRWLGKILMLPYLLYWLIVIGIYARQSEAFMFDFLFQQTPMYVLFIAIFGLVTYATYQGGIESIGRVSEFIGPLILLILIISLVLNIENVSWKHLLPVFATSGPMPIVRGALVGASSLSQTVMVVLMLISVVENPTEVTRKSLLGVLVSGILLTVTVIFVVAMFGATLTTRLWYPYFEMIRFISFMDFVQNIDAAVVVIWFGSAIIRLSILLFITSIGTSQFLGLKDWKRPVWMIGAWSFAVAMMPRNMLDVLVWYPRFVNEYYVLPALTAGIPILLLLVEIVRRGMMPSRMQ